MHPGEAGALLQDLLISVTNFFRDRECFDALRREIPVLFQNKTPADTIRVWVPACASGDEAYSIAILLSEHARTLDAPPALQVFATDLDEDVLAEARTGLYPKSIANDVSEERLQRYFVREQNGYRVRRELREVILFAVHDLLKDSPFSRLDLISCRNLLIYLNDSAQQRAFDIFHFALRPDGRLFLGTSESAESASQLFQPIDKKHRIYSTRLTNRTGLPVPSGSGTLTRSSELQEVGRPATALMRRPNAFAHAASLTPPEASNRQSLSWSELHLKLIDELGPASLVINENYDILHLSETAGQFLKFSAGEPSTNLFHAVHPALRVELRAALFRARQTNQPSMTPELPLELEGKRRLVNIKASPALKLGTGAFLINFELQGEAEAGAHTPVIPDADGPLVQHLEREIEETKQHWRDIVEQQEASAAELKANNEELQAMNEELHSATEELETSREELQSINEELTTVNQELKSNVDELAHSNSDLRNLMGASAIATVFLDRELRITRFTPPAVDLFSLIPGDVGRPLAHLRQELQYPELIADAARVLEQLMPSERQVADSTGRFFLARLLPYRTTDERIAGVVLTFVDVTELHLAQEALRRAQHELERRVTERTAELDTVNEALRTEIRMHQQAQRSRQELQNRLVNAQEDERGRISRELHDQAGQQITALMLSMKSLEVGAPDVQTPAKWRELRAIAEQIGRGIHQLASELRPAALDELGLSRALSGYLDAWSERSGIAVDFLGAGIDDPRLPSVVETTLYRIIQEAMNNVLKHAAAQSVSVSVERRAEIVLAIVEDDGAGFDAEAVQSREPSRLGIAGMQERAEILGGALTIESSTGGTTVRVQLPLI